MKCVICKNGKTVPGTTTVILNRGEATVIFKNVPADICENCGEYYLSTEVTREILAKAEDSMKNGVEVEVRKYAA
jgi:YgiT-type zinc finger domain-containing protein